MDKKIFKGCKNGAPLLNPVSKTLKKFSGGEIDIFQKIIGANLLNPRMLLRPYPNKGKKGFGRKGFPFGGPRENKGPEHRNWVLRKKLKNEREWNIIQQNGKGMFVLKGLNCQGS